MKGLMIVFFLFLTVTLTACSGTTGPKPQPGVTLPTQIVGETGQVETDPTTLEDFVTAINNHQVNEAFDLFNEESIVSEINLAGAGTINPQINLAQSWKNKAEVKVWLEYQVGANIEIVPDEFEASENIITLKTLFYYSNQVRNVVLCAQVERGKFSYLRLVIESINQT